LYNILWRDKSVVGRTADDRWAEVNDKESILAKVGRCIEDVWGNVPETRRKNAKKGESFP
jgi:hypothetical protein